MSDFKLPILILAALLGLCIGIPYALTSSECSNYMRLNPSVQTQMQYGTCYVNDGKRWYRWDEWKFLSGTKGAN